MDTLPSTAERAIDRVAAGSSAARYWARRSSTFPGVNPSTRARSRPCLDRNDTLTPASAHAPKSCGLAPTRPKQAIPSRLCNGTRSFVSFFPVGSPSPSSASARTATAAPSLAR